jgi:ubiquinone/menaquinone biosynthesis C-methylase UbiE
VYYDQVVAEYTAWYHTESPLGYALRVRQQRVVELLDQPGGRILDVGCGPGMLASELLYRGYEFWGIDASSGMIQQCRKQFGTVARAHFAVGDAVHLPFADEFFDVVVCIGVLDRLQANEAALKEMARVVKPNGTLVISFPNLVSPYSLSIQP